MKTILVVENSLAVQMFLREMLESKGYRTLGATTCKKACEILTSSSRVNLVVSDYDLTDCQGIEILREVRANPRAKKMPVIFLMEEITPEMADAGKLLGSTALIKKPYQPERLFSEIERMCQ